MSEPTITLSELTAAQQEAGMWGKLDALRDETGLSDAAPAEAFTVNQWAERYGLTRSSAEREVEQLVKSGRLQSGRARRRGTDGRLSMMRVYWPA
jgi:ABC-type Na+ transport system ATPase subunit NatA